MTAIAMISPKQSQQEQVRLWGAEKVAANEADAIRRATRPNKRLPFHEKHNTGDPLIGCHAADCEARFFHVEARGQRAPFCLDCADSLFGKR